MTKKEKARYILVELEKLYPETPVPLDHKDAYTLLIAVLLSAQCTDERVNKITPLLFEKDTHIHRLLTRWGISTGKNVKETEEAAKKLFPKETWNKLHLQIIFYGREYSPARSPKKEIDFITRTIGTAKALKELK